MDRNATALSRRRFLAGSLAGAALLPGLEERSLGGEGPAARQATGVKVGEVTPTSAIVWMRTTAHEHLNRKGRSFPRGKVVRLPEDVDVAGLLGACPGAPGRVRVVYGTRADLKESRATAWVETVAKDDFTHQFHLSDLRPATTYFYAAETTGPGGRPVHGALRGRFRTAPGEDRFEDVSFTVVTGTMFKDLDHPDGFHIYPAMQALRPNFFVHTGDNVYFDNDDVLANTVPLARHHWHRMHGLPRHVEFHRHVPCCFQKDDHEAYYNDCWPGRQVKAMLPLTFADGLRIFREQCPMGERTWRTFRWGRGLQVWLVEGRDFRSPNTLRDGPDKTIWGKEQKAWLFRTLRESTATYKVLLSPTPIVGPDRGKGKNDNHANDAFRTEGDEVRGFFRQHLPERFAVVCGDRHWQYHSVHPETRVQEFCCGPASDLHAGGSPGLNKEYHRFHRVRGGFLSVNFTHADGKSRLTLRHHDVMGKVVYEFAL